MYNFEKFTNTGAKLSNYSISLNPSFSFGFLSGFYNKEGIKNYEKVVLFYDKDKQAVAFKFTNDLNAEGAFKIVHGKKQSTGSTTTRSFIIENDLGKKEYFGKRIPKRIIDNNFGELFVIELLADEKDNRKSI